METRLPLVRGILKLMPHAASIFCGVAQHSCTYVAKTLHLAHASIQCRCSQVGACMSPRNPSALAVRVWHESLRILRWYRKYGIIRRPCFNCTRAGAQTSRAPGPCRRPVRKIGGTLVQRSLSVPGLSRLNKVQR